MKLKRILMARVLVGNFLKPLFFVLVLIQGCAAPATRNEDGKVITISQRDERAYDSLEALYRKGEFRSTLRDAQNFLDAQPDSPTAFKVHNLIGLSHAQLGQFDQSEKSFDAALKTAPRGHLRNVILFNKAKVLISRNKNAEAIIVFDQMDLKQSPEEERVKYLRSRLEASRKLNSHFQISVSLAELVEASPSRVNEGGIQEELQSFVRKLQAQELDQLRRSSRNRTLVAQVYDRLIAIAESESKNSLAGNLRIERSRRLGEILTESQEVSTNEAVEQRKFLQRVPFKPRALGVLLPLSGDRSVRGEKVREMLETMNKISNQPIELIFQDTKSTNDGAANAARALLDQGVALLMGIDNTQNAIAARKAIEETEAVYISFALSSAFNPGGRAYQFSVTQDHQLSEAIKYTVRSLNSKNLGIVRSRDSFGDQWETAFWRAISGQPVRVKGYGLYEPSETDFTSLVAEISGVSDRAGRRAEWDELQRLRAAQATTRSRGQARVEQLPPRPAFDTLVLMDSPRVAGQILPTLRLLDLRVQVIGTNLLNDPEIIRRAGRNANGLLMADLLIERPARYLDEIMGQALSDPSGQLTNRGQNLPAQDRYFNQFETVPYLAFEIFKDLLSQRNATSWDSVNSLLTEGAQFDSSIGVVTLRGNVFYPPLKILQVQGGNIVPVL